MKTKQLKFTLLTLLVGIIASVTFSSCSAKVPFLNSAVVPAAQGTVQIAKDKNDNYTIKMQVINLAGPERLTPPRNVYVVWLITADNRSRNVGQITTTSNLNANFETVSAFRPTKIMITAEDEAGVSYPSSSEIILTTAYLK